MKKDTVVIEALQMTKADLLLAVSFLLAGIICFVGIIYFNSLPAGQVQVKVEGKVVGIYSLEKDREIELDYKGENTVVIKDGKVKMVYANCPDQYCVKHREISRNGESIICLPNQVVVSVTGGEEQDADGVTN